MIGCAHSLVFSSRKSGAKALQFSVNACIPSNHAYSVSAALPQRGGTRRAARTAGMPVPPLRCNVAMPMTKQLRMAHTFAHTSIQPVVLSVSSCMGAGLGCQQSATIPSLQVAWHAGAGPIMPEEHSRRPQFTPCTPQRQGQDGDAMKRRGLLRTAAAAHLLLPRASSTAFSRSSHSASQSCTTSPPDSQAAATYSPSASQGRQQQMRRCQLCMPWEGPASLPCPICPPVPWCVLGSARPRAPTASRGHPPVQ